MNASDLKLLAAHFAAATALAVVSVALTLAFVPEAWTLAFEDQLAGTTRRALWGQALLGALLWPSGYASIRMIGRLRSRGCTQRVVRVTKTRGTVMLETIIAMPVILLMIFGLCQFALNNIAAVMINYATYSAARATWVWEGESANETGLEDAGERARVAVATAMTPVTYASKVQGERESEIFSKARGILVAAQYSSPHPAMGESGIGLGGQLAGGGKSKPPSLAEVLGVTSFQARSALQMTAAYHATVIDVEYIGKEVQTTVKFQHALAMPLVGPVFGIKTTVAGRTGYFMLFERKYKLKRMMKAHRDTTGLIGDDNVPRML